MAGELVLELELLLEVISKAPAAGGAGEDARTLSAPDSPAAGCLFYPFPAVTGCTLS